MTRNDLLALAEHARSSSDAELIERASSHMGRADFQEVLCDCHELAHRFAQARADGERAGRAAALEEAAKVAKSYWRCLTKDELSMGAVMAICNGISAEIRALIEVKA